MILQPKTNYQLVNRLIKQDQDDFNTHNKLRRTLTLRRAVFADVVETVHGLKETQADLAVWEYRNNRVYNEEERKISWVKLQHITTGTDFLEALRNEDIKIVTRTDETDNPELRELYTSLQESEEETMIVNIKYRFQLIMLNG